MGGKSGGGGNQVTGYRYFFDILMAVCRGPVEVVSIKVGDREALFGVLNSNGTIRINQPDLFGGNDKEGGIVGDLTFNTGSADQVLQDGAPRGTLSFFTQPSIGDTLTINGEVIVFADYVPHTGGEGGGGGGDAGGGT